MTQAGGRTTMALTARTRSMFKADHPREIDSHINFFGGGGEPASDMCGEALLDALTSDASTEEADEGSSCA